MYNIHRNCTIVYRMHPLCIFLFHAIFRLNWFYSFIQFFQKHHADSNFEGNFITTDLEKSFATLKSVYTIYTTV